MIVVIVLLCLNTVIGLISPISTALGYFIKNIKHSDCCGSKVEMQEVAIEDKAPTYDNGMNLNKKALEDIINRLSNTGRGNSVSQISELEKPKTN